MAIARTAMRYPTRVPSQKVTHSLCTHPRTLLTAESDPADATRSYPPDWTDKANSLNQIAF
jgi:hypothetical protein